MDCGTRGMYRIRFEVDHRISRTHYECSNYRCLSMETICFVKWALEYIGGSAWTVGRKIYLCILRFCRNSWRHGMKESGKGVWQYSFCEQSFHLTFNCDNLIDWSGYERLWCRFTSIAFSSFTIDTVFIFVSPSIEMNIVDGNVRRYDISSGKNKNHDGTR